MCKQPPCDPFCRTCSRVCSCLGLYSSLIGVHSQGILKHRSTKVLLLSRQFTQPILMRDVLSSSAAASSFISIIAMTCALMFGLVMKTLRSPASFLVSLSMAFLTSSTVVRLSIPLIFEKLFNLSF